MSGELFLVRIDFGCSIVTVVRRLGIASSASTWSSHSPSSTRSFRLKRVGIALRVAPRPWFDSTGTARVYRAGENKTRTSTGLALALACSSGGFGRAFRTGSSQLRSTARERRPSVLGHCLELRRVLVIEPLVDPHVPHDRRDIVARLPVWNGLDPE